MSTVAARTTNGALPPLEATRQAELLRFAQFWVVATTVFTGVSLALGAVILAPFPGTNSDPMMKAFGYAAVSAFIATLLKILVVRLWGRQVETKLSSNRPIRLRQALSRDVRWSGIIGGAGQAIYSILTVVLVAHLAPSSLGAARALVLLPIAGVELFAGILKPSRRVILRLAVSIPLALLGASAVIVGGPLVAGNGLHIFTGQGSTLYGLLLIALIIPGNLGLAIAEYAEWKGAQRAQTSAPVYTLARFVYYTITCVVVAVAWGIWHGDFPVLWSTLHMCVDRWYLVVPATFLWGLTDFARICSKRVVSTTSMYVIGSASVAINAVVQAVAKHVAPQYYGFVSDTWMFMARCVVGAGFIVLGTWAFPYPKAEAPPGTTP